MNFLYQDASWLVVTKPASLSTHRSHPGDIGLAEWLLLHHGVQVHICSRLDKETSGVLVFALTPEASREAQEIHEQDRALKTYYFIARPTIQKSWQCTEPLDGKPCKTMFKQMELGGEYSIYQAKIHRGRTHQIRRHAAFAGIPILGDRQHGGDRFARLCLHCQEVQWPDMEVWHAPRPAWFSALLSGVSKATRAVALAENRYPFLSGVADCCRLIHRGEMDISIDKYGEYLCITGYDETLSAQNILDQCGDIPQLLCAASDCRGGVVKTNRRDPHKRTLFADMVSFGETSPDPFYVEEHGVQFEVGLNGSQHVGLFLDQRDSRRRIAMRAQDARMANLFAFTCSFSIHAIACGAREVISVDLAGGCLNRGRRNLERNGLKERGISRFIKDDVRKWLGRQVRKKQQKPDEFESFDLVVCDPPVFAMGGKGKRFQVEKEWAGLVRDVATILSTDGVALFANNHRAGKEKKYFELLQGVFHRVTRLNPPLDFPVQKGHPAHVRIYWCEK